VSFFKKCTLLNFPRGTLFNRAGLEASSALGSIGISFFIQCPKQVALQDPDNRDLKQLVYAIICSAWQTPIIGITLMHL
jgi:hypothetical protein